MNKTTLLNRVGCKNPKPGKPVTGEQGWLRGESTRLSPMWSGSNSRTRRHMWVEFVVGSRPCSKRFFSGYSGFPLSSETNIYKFQFDLESVPNLCSALNTLKIRLPPPPSPISYHDVRKQKEILQNSGAPMVETPVSLGGGGGGGGL